MKSKIKKYLLLVLQNCLSIVTPLLRRGAGGEVIGGLRLLIFILFFSSCHDKKDDLSPKERTEVLADIADNVIIKNYEALSRKSDSLVLATNAFVENVNEENLTALRSQWKNIAVGWKMCEQFGYGPGETLVPLDDEIGTWPINESLIETEINDTTRTALPDDFVAKTGSTRKGIYAIEYFIFANPTKVLSTFTTNEKAAIRKKYLQLIATDIQKNAKLVYQAWISGYRDTFIQANGLDNGSSLSVIVNKMVENLEVVINTQIGNPIGKKSFDDNGTLRPTEVEARYSNESIALSLASIEAIKAVFTADNQGLTGTGIDGYVEFLKINTDGKPLQQTINSQLDTFYQAVAAIPAPMQTAVEANTATINTAWKEGKTLLLLMKNDLTVNIGVQINFNSNDGD